jgi:uncharacterized protein (TIGR02271 family)
VSDCHSISAKPSKEVKVAKKDPIPKASGRRSETGKDEASEAVEQVIPVIEEEVEVSKRKVETGVTRITKKVHEREEVIDEPLLQEEVHVDRIPVNRYVDEPVPVRQEKDKTIVPVFEEVLVVNKRLLLKEELHISKRTKEVHKPQEAVLRSEEAVIEKMALPGQSNKQKD